MAASNDDIRELSIHLSAAQGDRLEQAAAAAGQSVEEFAASALRRAADAVLAPPSAHSLAQAADEHKRRLADGSLHLED